MKYLRVGVMALTCLSLLSCAGGEVSDSNGDGDDGADQSSAVTPISSGPGMSSEIALECPAVECTERGDGTYVLRQRCEQEGLWQHPSCPESQFSWSQREITGTLEWPVTSFRWQLESVVDWTIRFPADCGGCDAVAGMSGLDNLSCGGDDTCECTASSTQSEYYQANAATTVEGARIRPIFNLTSDGEATEEVLEVREFDVAACTDGVGLVLYYENGQRFYFEKQ